MTVVKKLLWVIIIVIPPFFAALWAGATGIANGSFSPWQPQMIDMDVYRRTGEMFLNGQDFYDAGAEALPFIYPPVAALFSIPFTWGDLAGTQQVWLLINAAMVIAMVHRLGLTGWRLSLVSAGAIWLIEPLRTTLGFGQVNIFLTALVLLDIVPGPRLLDRIGIRLPQGWLIGVATAIKLTPALFAVYLFFSGRVKPALIAFGSFCVTTLIGFLVLPDASMTFWGRLIQGDSGINTGMKYYTNQSVIGNFIRFTKENPDQIPITGAILAAGVCLLGLIAAILWERHGQRTFAVCLAALASMMMSPIAWSHHFIWYLPLIIVVLRDKKLPTPVRVVAIGLSIWGAHAPFNEFGDYYIYERPLDEFELTTLSLLVAAGSMILCIALFLVAIVYGIKLRREKGLSWLPLTMRHDEKLAAAGGDLPADDGTVEATASGSTARRSAGTATAAPATDSARATEASRASDGGTPADSTPHKPETDGED